MTEIVSFKLRRKPTEAEKLYFGQTAPDLFTSDGERVIYGKSYPKGTVFVRNDKENVPEQNIDIGHRS